MLDPGHSLLGCGQDDEVLLRAFDELIKFNRIDILRDEVGVSVVAFVEVERVPEILIGSEGQGTHGFAVISLLKTDERRLLHKLLGIDGSDEVNEVLKVMDVGQLVKEVRLSFSIHAE